MAERTKKTLILLAHGSRAAETAAEMRGLAERIASSRPEFLVRGAFLSLIDPDLSAAVRDAVKDGAKDIVVLPLFLFSGTFFPISQLPDWLEPVAYLTPLFHGVELVRKIALPGVDESIVTDLGIWVHVGYLSVMALIGLVLSVRFLDRRIRQ